MTIVPRWEWRTFGASFRAAEERLAAAGETKVEESDEVYLLSLHGNASVKLRGGLLDAKRLLHTDGTLEQWTPVLKAEIPLSEHERETLLELLGVSDLRNADLRETTVRKHRSRSTFGGCMAELSEFRTKEGRTRTIAVEATDPDLVRAAVREL